MTRALAVLLLCCASCAHMGGNGAANDGGGVPVVSGIRPTAKSAATLTTAAVSAADTVRLTVSFRMPLYHDRFPLSGEPDTTSLLPTGYHRWEIGYSSMSKACRDSGLAWCRDIRNFGAWRPGAQIVPFRSGYAAPGQYVTVDTILVSSFSWPYALWGRAWTDVPGRWTYITERASN